MEMESLPNGDSSVIITTPSVPPRLNHIAESLKLEHQFLKVPFEHFKKNMRANHRIVEKEMNAVISSVAEAADKEMSKEEAVQHLTSLVSKLQGLKRKVNLTHYRETRTRKEIVDGFMTVYQPHVTPLE